MSLCLYYVLTWGGSADNRWQVDALQVSLHTSNIETNNVCPRRPAGTIYINLYPIRAGFVCLSLDGNTGARKVFLSCNYNTKKVRLE